MITTPTVSGKPGQAPTGLSCDLYPLIGSHSTWTDPRGPVTRPGLCGRIVDRRFNRRKYNAAKTIQAFSTRLRDQIDLDTLSSELLAVVGQTMEPTRVSVWLRPPPPGSPGTAPRAPRPTPWAY